MCLGMSRTKYKVIILSWVDERGFYTNRSLTPIFTETFDTYHNGHPKLGERRDCRNRAIHMLALLR